MIHCWFDFTRPVRYIGNADPAFIQVTFDAAELSTAVEKFRIPAVLPMRTVITGKNDQGVFGQSFIGNSLYDFSYILIQSRDHGRKLCMGQGLGHRIMGPCFQFIPGQWSLIEFICIV